MDVKNASERANEMPQLDIDNDVDNCLVQNYLSAWSRKHLEEGDHEWDVVEGMIEMLQETLGR